MNRKRIPLYHERADKIFNWSATQPNKGRDGSMGLPFPNCLPDSVYEEFVESGADDANWWIQSGECKEIPRIRALQSEPFELMSHYGFLVTPESEDLDYNIPNDVKEDLKNDRAVLCLSFIQEGDCYETFFTDVYNFCNELGMPHKNFVFCSNGANLEIEYDKFCEENPISLNLSNKFDYRKSFQSNVLKVSDHIKFPINIHKLKKLNKDKWSDRRHQRITKGYRKVTILFIKHRKVSENTEKTPKRNILMNISMSYGIVNVS